MQFVSLSEGLKRPMYQNPIGLLIAMTIAMPISFFTWWALLNNFVIEVANFDGADIGWLHTIREIPGFLAVGVLAILLLMREQILALISLGLLGLATAATAYFPTWGGIMMITLLSSIGFHYFETVNQSLQLQWIEKGKAPQVLGWLLAVGSGATLCVFGVIVVGWTTFNLDFNTVFVIAGSMTMLIALGCFFWFGQFKTPHVQRKQIILRRRYWLYYVLQFLSGARRQIFVVFAGFMMVEKFGFEVHEITSLYLINLVVNMVFAPLIGNMIGKIGEQKALLIEYAGLVLIFLAYGGIYFFGWGILVASALYILDHLFFSMALALKTYFQKIADPEEIAPTAAVAFTINHIAAVCLPVLLGYLWLTSPMAVFIFAAGLAVLSFGFALLIPRHPSEGNETRWHEWRKKGILA
ncbi:MAG: MFS transporter [Paracoccaceae bacterium]